ncbi:hypothetical protein [Paenibacillus sp. 481]|uniref:hypothetical protein n=1 Tax=Paenibacillus sp. 481 TaxID=2835869 RepID=UPI001E4A1334|nr:hypothetical protein [Paenibacillus sp. 481]UHA71842.1 hypothetical protein KIK04_13950 [Paenibacillus sp. 481]
MIPVPIDERVIYSLRGRFVCAVMKDGRRYTGQLRALENGKMILYTNDFPYESHVEQGQPLSQFSEQEDTSKSVSPEKKRTKKKKAAPASRTKNLKTKAPTGRQQTPAKTGPHIGALSGQLLGQYYSEPLNTSPYPSSDNYHHYNQASYDLPPFNVNRFGTTIALDIGFVSLLFLLSE